MTIEFISPELANKILESLEAGSSNVTSTLTSVMNEFLNFMIFVEVMNVSKFLLVMFLVWLIRKAFKLFEAAQETQTGKDSVRGWSILVIAVTSSIGVWLSYSSFISLGKVLLAPKIYLIEMAVSKVKEIKNISEAKTK